MSKPVKPVRRPSTDASHSNTPHAPANTPTPDTPVARDTRDSRPLLARLLDTPHLERLVPQLQPDVVHRIVDCCGLEDCAELVALVTPRQLAGVLDLDLWRSQRPGQDETFSPERFGLWLEVLVESGDIVAARALAELDPRLVTAGLSSHIRVFDLATRSIPGDLDEDLASAEDPAVECGLTWEVGGYLIVARRTEAWDAVVSALVALDDEYPAAFHRVMRECRALSNSDHEIDGLDDLLAAPDQVMHDLASDRERRREMQGFAAPAAARAFLQISRQHVAEEQDALAGGSIPKAYFRAVDEATTEDSKPRERPALDGSAPAEDAASATTLFEVLADEGLTTGAPRALLSGPRGGPERLAHIRVVLQYVHDHDPVAYWRRSQEITFLANTMASGCSIQARPFTPQEASDAAVAVCNLGLQNWPHRGAAMEPIGDPATTPPQDLLVDQDLVGVFQVGWRVLYEHVCLVATERLIDVLTGLQCEDREIQVGLDTLRSALTRHVRTGQPWRARDALDVMVSLDMPAWAALLGLIDECPVLHAGIGAAPGSRVRAVSPSAFEFISENAQIALVRTFMESLPERLQVA